jgi:hypothetical protein
MGLFPLAATMSSILNPLRQYVARGRWPEVLWRRRASSMHQCSPIDNSPQLVATWPLPQSRATTIHLSDRAPLSIQRAALTDRRSRIAAALRRWMLPTVERGPPVHISV